MASTYPTQKDFDRMHAFYGENKIITGEYDHSLAVKCENGTFVGIDYGDVIAYKGIPFAKAPINELRWKPPVYVDKEDVVKQAYYFGKAAIQEPWFSELSSCYPQSEDCLYLNIYTNRKCKNKKAVMVFIHGGAYGYGGTSDPIYDGNNFVKKHEDIILVTIAYRVGIMGFIDFSFVEGSKGYEDSVNLGLLDQVMALKWISNNIENFGGDKDNVTIFGESAGGGSVSLLPVMDIAKGLFKRSIGESGSIALTYDRKEFRPFTESLLKLSGAKNMQDLLNLTTKELQEYNKPLNEKNNFPCRDGKIVPKDLYKAYKDGKSAWCDMINGTNKDECRYWINEMGGLQIYAAGIPLLFDTQLSVMSKEDQKTARQFFYKNEDGGVYLRLTEFENDIIFRCPAQKQLQYHSDNGGVAYNYFWTYPSGHKNMGACHAVELNHVFNNLDEKIYTGDNVNRDLANEVQQMWVNFAKTGDPSTDNNKWPKYNSETKKTLILGEKIFVKDNLFSRRSKLVEPLLKYMINGNYSVLKLNTPYIKIIVSVVFVIILLVIIIIKYLF